MHSTFHQVYSSLAHTFNSRALVNREDRSMKLEWVLATSANQFQMNVCKYSYPYSTATLSVMTYFCATISHRVFVIATLDILLYERV